MNLIIQGLEIENRDLESWRNGLVQTISNKSPVRLSG